MQRKSVPKFLSKTCHGYREIFCDQMKKTEGRGMKKRRFAATKEPMDLECFIANFIQDYEECDALQVGQHQEAFSPESRDPHYVVGASR
jgi:hypothetical protein